MSGSHLDGLYIKEVEKVPRRSLTFNQPHSSKRARVDEPTPDLASIATDEHQSTIPVVFPPPDEITESSLQMEVAPESHADGTTHRQCLHPPTMLNSDPLSLANAKNWTELRKHFDQRKPIDFKVVYAMVHAGQVDLLVYARVNKCFKCKTKRLIEYAIKRKIPQDIINELNQKMRGDVPSGGTNIDMSELSIEEGFARWIAALQKDNPMRSLLNLRQHNCPWSCAVCEKAVCYGHYEALEYLLQEGCPMGTKLCTLIIERELWTFLPLIVKYGYKLDPKIRFEFARYGQLGGLKAAVECGMKMVSEVCVLAALNGHLDCLTFAHEHGAKIDQKVCLGAVQQGHLSCLRYALQQGCTMTKILPTQAVKYQHMHILKYLHEQGCPMDKKTSKMAEDLPVPAAVELDIIL